MEEPIKFHEGLDVHKDSISVAVAELGRAPGRLVSEIPHDVSKLLKVLAKIGPATQLHIVYEAGPTGFVGRDANGRETSTWRSCSRWCHHEATGSLRLQQ